ncbi:MAG: hypothetical protein ACLFSI_02645 [Halorhodospira sp.]
MTTLYAKREDPKDVWNVILDGSEDTAVTLAQFRNRSGYSMLVGVAIGDMEQDDDAVDDNGDLILTNVDSVFVEDTVSSGQLLSFDARQGGKLMVPSGKVLAYTMSGDGTLDVTVSGMEY